jgi:hypothetical protein
MPALWGANVSVALRESAAQDHATREHEFRGRCRMNLPALFLVAWTVLMVLIVRWFYIRDRADEQAQAEQLREEIREGFEEAMDSILNRASVEYQAKLDAAIYN